MEDENIDPIEVELNREVDLAMKKTKISTSKVDDYDQETPSDLARRIERACDEVKLLLGFVVPNKLMPMLPIEQGIEVLATSGEILEKTYDLLECEVELLRDLVGSLISKSD